MKVTCDVMRDILPLYVENMLSADSCAMVNEHVEQCNACRELLHEMKHSGAIPADANAFPFIKIKAKLRRKKAQTILFSIMLSMVVFVLAVAFLTAPEYIPYREGSVLIHEFGNGSVLVQFYDTVYGYDINRYLTEDKTGYEYHITTWNSIWNRTIRKSNVNTTILNPNGENVVSVYYYQTDGSEDKLVYGKDITPNGGVITLPRLFLSSYALMAIGFSAVCGIIMLLFRRNKRVLGVSLKIFFLPICYLVSHLMIKGFSTSSYTATRDFFAILLLMIPLYIAVITAVNLTRQKKADKT